MLYNGKVIIVKNSGYCEEESIDVDVIDSALDIVKQFPYEFTSDEVIKSLLQNQGFTAALKKHGFVNTNKEKELGNLKSSKKYYLYNKKFKSLLDIDLVNIQDHEVSDLVKPHIILLQEIDRSSLKGIFPKIYKKYITERKKEIENEKKAKERKSLKIKKSKDKEIEKARQILKEAGEI